MKLKKGYEAEYKKRHDEIWPELSALLTTAGISNYSIFLDRDTSTLFAVHQLADRHTVDALPDHPIMQKWWSHMSDIMETNPDLFTSSCRLRGSILYGLNGRSYCKSRVDRSRTMRQCQNCIKLCI